MLKIWGRSNSPNVQKVLWTCAELDVAYERIDVGGPFGGLDDPAYRARNPNGLIPMIEDEGFVLWESSAIVRYLAARDAALRLTSAAAAERAIIDQWIDWHLSHQAQAVRALVIRLLRPTGAPPTEAEIAGLSDAASATMRVLEGRLAKVPFLAGERFTIADIIVGVAAQRWRTLPAARPSLPALEAWLDRLAARPAFAANVRFS